MDNFIRKATVTNIIDGDTVDLIVDTGYESLRPVRIRLKDIDTPERGQEGYHEARNFLIDTILNKEIWIESTRFKTGGFGRYLGVLYTLDGENLNDRLITEGLAVPYVR